MKQFKVKYLELSERSGIVECNTKEEAIKHLNIYINSFDEEEDYVSIDTMETVYTKILEVENE